MAVISASRFAPLLSVNESSGFHGGNGKITFNMRPVLNPAWDISETKISVNTKMNQKIVTFTSTNLLNQLTNHRQCKFQTRYGVRSQILLRSVTVYFSDLVTHT